MNDLIRSVLSRRPWVPDQTLLDCLDITEWHGMRIRAGIIPRITVADLQNRWQCSDLASLDRLESLRSHQLIDVRLHPGIDADGYWELHRVGPVA